MEALADVENLGALPEPLLALTMRMLLNVLDAVHAKVHLPPNPQPLPIHANPEPSTLNPQPSTLNGFDHEHCAKVQLEAKNKT